MPTSATNLIESLEALRCAIERLENSPRQERVRSAFNDVLQKSEHVVQLSLDLTASIGPSCSPPPTPIRPL